MDYEKKYKEALERAKRWAEGTLSPERTTPKGVCETIFPELAESEDERIRKGLIDIFNTALGQDFLQRKAGLNEKEVIAYLEKQKEKKQTLDLPAGFYFIDQDGNKYYSKKFRFNNGTFTTTMKVKKEKKPTEWKPTEEQFNYLAKAIMTLGEEGDCKTAGVLSEIRNGLKCSFPDWKVSPDYPEEGCNVSLNGEVKKIQEWSEEDEKMIERLITRLNWITYNTRTDGTSPNITFFDEIDWLKSLRPQPHWKPSEEQMDRLVSIVAALRKDDCDDMADFLAEIYHGLEKL